MELIAVECHEDPNKTAGVVVELETWDRTTFFLKLVGTSMTTTHLSILEPLMVIAQDRW